MRLPWAIFLFCISFPGLVLWLPVFITSIIAVHEYKKTGPIFGKATTENATTGHAH